jgi:hypothetical protein
MTEDIAYYRQGTMFLVGEMIQEIIQEKAGMPAFVERDPPLAVTVCVNWLHDTTARTQALFDLVRIQAWMDGEAVCLQINVPALGDHSETYGRKLKSSVRGIKFALGRLFPSFLELEPDEHPELVLTQEQLVSINRLIRRWKRRPDSMSKLSNSITVSFGALIHQIEADGHCHT